MKIEGVSLVYVDGIDPPECQQDMRLIVRPIKQGCIYVEFENDSTKSEDIQNEDRFFFQCSTAEAREIAAALILAAETAEKQQEGGSDD